ncbi:hypothetical protein FDP41_007237 [Naegleria fowleri]|uniref:Uncharacterized protein n=2 Tax=Naegleria fowleri TaxID=5763 RepID=A0A6A5BIL3_NAEFO|nr:uncharacterized protein FDP41_007237 [Naegleria fowleri]KAF0973850.1 hypothetical protein FDP41_007237 [Naegleria fowleri]CAG4709387.1 unnamed protein product [Naegleria fowleri]
MTISAKHNNQIPLRSVRPIYSSSVPSSSLITNPSTSHTSSSSSNTTNTPLINIETGKRKDGRTCDKFRNVFLQVGVIKQARGSAYLEFHQGTKIICAVYGPRQVSAKNVEFSDTGRLQCEYRVAQFASLHHNSRSSASSAMSATKSHQATSEEIEFGIHMREALESSLRLDKYPKSVIDVYCFVLEDDGSALSGAISCASLALANAGIEMVDMVSACTTSELEGQIVVDPTSHEYKYASGGMVCGFMSNLNEVTQLTQVGDMSFQKVSEAMDLCIDGCTKLYQLMQQCLIESMMNTRTTITTRE